MGRTLRYSISILFLFIGSSFLAYAQDTIPITLKIKIGIEASGPMIYYADKKILNTEGYISVDLNEKRSATIAAGFLRYKFSQYNYQYLNNGSYIKAGMDFNFLKPDKAQGKYFIGVGLRYGLSRFSSETPSFEITNYWGTTTSSLPVRNYWGHFLELAPGVRAEVLKNFTLGWSINIRKLIYTSTGNDLKPVYFPGYGDGSKSITAGLSYYIVWNIPYRKIKAIIRKDVPEEKDDTKDTGTGTQNTNSNSQQGSTIRQ